MSGRIIAGAVLLLLIVVGGIFVLIAKTTGDSTTNQEGVLPAVHVVAVSTAPVTPVR